MSRKWIVYGTEYYEKNIEVKVNAPSEELAIRAAEDIVSARARRNKANGSLSVDWAELVGLENSRFDSPEATKRIFDDLKKELSNL